MSAPDDHGELSWRDTLWLSVETILSGIPVVGPPIVRARSGYLTQLRLDRLDRFKAALDEEWAAIKDRVELGERQREELPSLIEAIAERVTREPREEKLAWLRAFTTGACLDGEGWDLSKRLTFLRILDGLSPADLFFLWFLRPLKRLEPAGEWEGKARFNLEYTNGHHRKGFDLPVGPEWATMYLWTLKESGLVAARETPLGSAVLLDAPNDDPWPPRWVWLRPIGHEFLAAFAFPGGKPVFGPPWGGVEG